MLSTAGATVVLACRRAREGDDAARRISSITSRRVVSLKCDLESLASVNEVQPQRCSTGTHQASRVTRFFQFVASFMKLNLPLHLLFCNAGQMLSPFRYHALSGCGFEKQFASNHLGHFHLVHRLLGVMQGCSTSKRAACWLPTPLPLPPPRAI